MHNDPLSRIFSEQPYPTPSEGAWAELRARLEPRNDLHRRPFRATLRRHPLRWSVALASLLLLTTGTLWLTTGRDSVSSWSQVHAAAQWGSESADPSWVAMEVASP